MSERDPKVDPAAGDALIAGPQWQSERYEVVGRTDAEVRYQIWPGQSALGRPIDSWRKWMRGAEVIAKGDA